MKIIAGSCRATLCRICDGQVTVAPSYAWYGLPQKLRFNQTIIVFRRNIRAASIHDTPSLASQASYLVLVATADGDIFILKSLFSCGSISTISQQSGNNECIISSG